MLVLSNKKIVISVFVVLIIGIVAVTFLVNKDEPEAIIEDTAPTQEPQEVSSSVVIGTSVEGRPIEAYTFGTGDTHLVFVGGIHGGYEWNSVLLAYQLHDYVSQNPQIIPSNISMTIIPSANPDGLYKVVQKESRFIAGDISPVIDQATGRFNANNVDLNRNFDCKWQPESTWRNQVVSAGTAPFSEPEAQAIRNFVNETNPSAVVFFHSQANTVYASECHEGVLPQTLDIMNAYASASGYSAVSSFDSYEITGDAEGWLASIGIPAITVELKTHESVEWEQNLRGIRALLDYFDTQE